MESQMIQIRERRGLLLFAQQVVAYKTLSCRLGEDGGYRLRGDLVTRYGYVLGYPEGDFYMIELLKCHNKPSLIRSIDISVIGDGLYMRNITLWEADAMLDAFQSGKAKFDHFDYSNKEEGIAVNILAYLKKTAETAEK